MRLTPQNSFQNLVMLNERTSTILGSEKFRYGFQNQENDDDIKGDGNSYDFGARIFDSRIGRFLSSDPVAHLQEGVSPFSFAGNSPIYYIDINGMFKWPGTADEQKALENKYPNVTKMMKNIHKLADEYPTLLQTMSDHTGLTIEQLKTNLEYGKGAEIVMIPKGDDREYEMGMAALSNPDTKKIYVQEGIMNDAENGKGDELNQGLFTLAIGLLHEEIHRGDRITNGGKVTGEWNSRSKVKEGSGWSKDWKKYEGDEGNSPGKQKIKWSETGHRPCDMEISVFNAPKGERTTLNDPGGGFSDSNYLLNRMETMKSNPQMTKEKLGTIFK